MRHAGLRPTRILPFLLVLLSSSSLGGCFLTPKPLSDAERAIEARADEHDAFAGQEPLTQPLTLREAFRRALAYNLDGRVKAREEALAQNDLDIAKYALLPKLSADGAYTTRNNLDASSSTAIATGQQSLVPSTSTDRSRFAADLALSWNILDFGVSYFNARQQANRILVAEEQRRKVIQTLMQDVRRAYWRAAGAQRLRQQIAAAIEAAQKALPAARKVETEGLRSPVDSLRYQKALLELIGQLTAVQHVLDISKVELASLINLPPGQPYTLALPPERALHLRSVTLPIAKMEETALVLNPDIREQSYDVRLSADETRKALLKLLPGVNLAVSPNYDSNSFLVNHFWVAGAARVTGNLADMIAIPATMERGDQALAVAVQRREAVSMAVLTKLHIAYQEYVSAAADYKIAAQLSEVDERLYKQISNRTVTDVQGDLERVSAQVSAVFSELRRYQSYADAQAALGRLYASLGIDLTPEHNELLDVAEVGAEVREAVAAHEVAAAAPPPREPTITDVLADTHP